MLTVAQDAASGRQWAYSQSPTSPISPVSPASIGIHKTYTLAGALSPRPKSRQHPSSSSQSSNAGPAPNSSSVSVSWSTSASYPDPRVQVQAGQQQQSAIHQTTVVSTAYGSSNINLGGMRSNVSFKPVTLVSILSLRIFPNVLVAIWFPLARLPFSLHLSSSSPQYHFFLNPNRPLAFR